MFSPIISSMTTEKLQKRLAALPRQRRQQLLAATIWLVLAIFCSVALGHYYGQRQSAAAERDRAEAQAAVALLAGQSLERIVAGDRISMQLLAQQMLKLPAITGIAVQDVESNTLAQVGDTGRGESLSAPVVLHDSIAGSVTVWLLPGSGVGFPWASLLLCLVFALPFSAAAALASGALAGSAGRRVVPVVAAHPEYEARPEPEPEPQVVAGLYLRPLNWAQLRNQLNRAALEKLQGDLEERMQLLRRIYDASPLEQAGPQQGLGFCGEDAAFRAVCCGLLLRQLQGSSPLQLALAVAPSQAESLDLSAELLLAQPRGLTLHDNLLEDPSLQGRIEHSDTNWGLEVTGLVPGYQKLLDNQLRQLQASAS